ncbi:hypothetical protein [Pseudomonas sp. TH31]|nr:hypothetical protein [Pseudomonas sp. TH31]
MIVARMKAAIFVEKNRIVLEDIEAAYELFAHQRDGVMKVAITA